MTVLGTHYTCTAMQHIPVQCCNFQCYACSLYSLPKQGAACASALALVSPKYFLYSTLMKADESGPLPVYHAPLLRQGVLLPRETSSLKLAKLRGCTFVNQYVVIKYLGRGACGRVFLCMDMTDNRLYAVKVCATNCLTLCCYYLCILLNIQLI